MTAWFQGLLGYGLGWFVATLIFILIIALPLMLAVAMIIYADRKIWAAMALRRGPNVVGPFGLLQSFADGLKVFLKETIIPSSANVGLFIIAPIITFTVALVAWAVIPFADGWVLADINVGLLYLLAVSSLGVYGIIIAGWASNSKYPFYSALRAAAQMVSYEVSIGFVLIPVVLWAGTFNLSGIVMAQQGHIFGLINGFGFNPLLFPLAVIFLISAMAETARAPFDLTEAESELVAGYQTEYSSMSFALFWLGEYGNVLLMCGMNAILFWGGWLPPIDWAPLYVIPGIFWFFIKILFFFFVFSWVKATVPALPLRPADAARLEDLPADLADLGVPGLGLSDAHEDGVCSHGNRLPWRWRRLRSSARRRRGLAPCRRRTGRVRSRCRTAAASACRAGSIRCPPAGSRTGRARPRSTARACRRCSAAPRSPREMPASISATIRWASCAATRLITSISS